MVEKQEDVIAKKLDNIQLSLNKIFVALEKKQDRE
jgi:hypothetical protein